MTTDIEDQLTASMRQEVDGVALTTDVLVGAAVLAAGASLYLTLRERPRAPPATVRITGASATLTLSF